MIWTDIVVTAALAVFVVAWWLRRMPGRHFLLAGSALLAAAAGIAGVMTFRWQDALGASVAGVFLVVLIVNRLRGAPPRTRAPWISGPLFTLLAAAAVGLIVLFPVGSLPRPSGEHPVGVRTFELVDASRPGVFAAPAGQPRRLLVRVWYPAGDVAGRPTAPYFTRREAETTATSMGRLFGAPFFLTYLTHVRTNAHPDAPLLAGARDLPVVMYSHGFTAFLGQNAALMEHLASHGYVVFSVQHTYDSSTTVFPNGDVAPIDPALFTQMAEAQGSADASRAAIAGATLDERLLGHIRMREQALREEGRLVRSAQVWVQDRMFVHDRLQAGDVPAEIATIARASRLDRVGEMGMSFGGAITGSLCLVDSRCAAGINLDGGDFPFDAFNAAMPVPFLMQNSDMSLIYGQVGADAPAQPRGFNEFSYEPLASAGTNPQVFRLQVLGSRHLGYSDLSLFMRRPARDPILGTTPADVMIGAQNDLVRGFFDRFLRGETQAFPRRALQAYGRWIAPVDNTDIRAWWAAKPELERAALERRIAAVRRPVARSARPAAAEDAP